MRFRAIAVAIILSAALCASADTRTVFTRAAFDGAYLNVTGDTLTGKLRVINGSEAAPSIDSAAGGGVFFTATALGITAGGETTTICGVGCAAGSGGTWGWSSTADATGTADLKLTRVGAKQLGWAGSTAGAVTHDFSGLTDTRAVVWPDLAGTVAMLNAGQSFTNATFTAGTGTETYVPTGVLESNTTSASTDADTNEKDLWTYTLPANTLNVNGRAVRITAWGTSGANANTKNIRLYFGATVLRLFTTTLNNGVWFMEAMVVRTGAATQVSRAWGGAGSTFQVMGVGNPAVTLSANTTIKVTGQNGTASAGDIVFSGAVVEYLP